MSLVLGRQSRAGFALSSVITFRAVPLAGAVPWRVLHRILGLYGWRRGLGSNGTLAVLFLRRDIPESSRWLARNGRIAEPHAIVARIEAAAERDTGRPLPPVRSCMADDAMAATRVRFAEIRAPAWRGRTIMLSVFQFFQAIGYCGFAAWVPTLLASKGMLVTRARIIPSSLRW